MNSKIHSDNLQEHIDRLNNRDDAYEALGLHQNASEREIRDRFKYLRKLVHPDKNGGCEQATKAFQRLQIFSTALLNRNEDINQNTCPNKDDKEDNSFDYEYEARNFERYQQWKRKFDQQRKREFDQQSKRKFEKEYTKDTFRRANGEFERGEWNSSSIFRYIRVLFYILVVLFLMGLCKLYFPNLFWILVVLLLIFTIKYIPNLFWTLVVLFLLGASMLAPRSYTKPMIYEKPPMRKVTNQNHPDPPRTLPPPSKLSNQTIFMRECYNVKSKTCVILLLPEKGMWSAKKSAENRQYFETSFETFALKQKIRDSKLGRLWTHYRDQPELENGIQILNETMTPLLLVANFGKGKYCPKKLENSENEASMRSWIFKCLNGKEKSSFYFDVSKWFIYSSTTEKYIPRIHDAEDNFQWSDLWIKLSQLKSIVLDYA